MKNKIINLYHFTKFFLHNKKKFVSTKYNSKNIILIEFNNFCSNHIGLSYLSNLLREKYNGKIIAYFGHVLLSYPFRISFVKKVLIQVLKTLHWRYYGVYNSFGTKNYFHPCKKEYFIESNHLDYEYKLFFKKVKNLNNLQNYKIQNIKVGDLMYDTFLKSNYDLKPTINLKDKKFKLFIKDFINLFFVWSNYFEKNSVKAVIGSHAVYSLAIPLRIAANKNIKSFVLSPEYLFKISKKKYHQGYECHFLKKIFNSLNKKKQKKIKKIAKFKINKIKDGNYSSDYPYVTKSPFGNKNKNYFKKYFNTTKKKFLIATHDFVDAPHAMGNSLFEDFYIWLKFLLDNSNKNIQWYIKTHPNFGSDWSIYIKYEREVVKKLIKKYKNIILLPQNITHNEIVRNKIDAVFTVNGTVGLDYSLLNTPVINASLNNPHINFKFNFHPKSKNELGMIIKKFNYKKKISFDEIYNFYAIKNVFFSKNWFFTDFEKTIKSVQSYHNLWKPLFYTYWIAQEYPNCNNIKLKNRLKNFISSSENFCLNNNNLGKF